jgi:hypothetical protein
MLAGVASANEITFAGYTTGAFSGNLPGASMVYQAGAFESIETSDGETGIGGSSNGLGFFTFNSSIVHNFTSPATQFGLTVHFTSPLVTTADFTALVTGNVRYVSNGIRIDFDNTPQLFEYSNDQYQGWFTLHMEDMNISGGAGVRTGTLSGFIQGEQFAVPDAGSSTLLIAIGLLAAGIAHRRTR